MPCEQYFEVAKQILGNAPDDVPDLESVRTLIKDIWDTRAAKLRRDIKMIIGGENTPLDNVTPMELTTMRPVFTQSMDVCARLESVRKPFNINNFGQFNFLRFVLGTNSFIVSKDYE